MNLFEMFNVPSIEDGPLSGTEVREYLSKVVDQYCDGSTEKAKQLFCDVLIVQTREICTSFCVINDYSTSECSLAQLATLQVQERTGLHAMQLMEKADKNTRLKDLEKRAWMLSELMVIIIDLPDFLENAISDETLTMHEVNNVSD